VLPVFEAPWLYPGQYLNPHISALKKKGSMCHNPKHHSPIMLCIYVEYK
jgi:hypothetical protein